VPFATGNVSLNKAKSERTADLDCDLVRYDTSSFLFLPWRWNHQFFPNVGNIWCHNPEDHNLNHQRRENLEPHTHNRALFNAVTCDVEYGITRIYLQPGNMPSHLFLRKGLGIPSWTLFFVERPSN
jgi:hypothetical protein